MAEASITSSAGPRAGGASSTLFDWLAERRLDNTFEVTRIAFDDLVDWQFAPDTGNLVHRSGRFFGVEGLRVHSDYGAVPQWAQPIIVQPEFGILGLLVCRVAGDVRCLVQVKPEPGNVNMMQLSPTVQATRSNYTRVHKGQGTNYLEYFVGRAPGRVLVDVLHSEQGSWFYRKRNRNVIVEVDGDVPPHPDFRWVSLRHLRQLLKTPNIVNMDTRSVLSCLPVALPDAVGGDCGDDDTFDAALVRSRTGAGRPAHSLVDLLNWFTRVKASHHVATQRIPLSQVARWQRSADEISHEERKYFSIVAVAARASSREVGWWTQPLLRPQGVGIVAFLARRIDGVLHVLVHARVEAGYVDVVELSPTVQCTPANYWDLPPESHPPFLHTVLRADPDQIRYDTVQSEEGGRFHHAQNRYLVLEVDDADTAPDAVPSTYRWVTLHQLTRLSRHTGYINVQTRSLLACMDALR